MTAAPPGASAPGPDAREESATPTGARRSHDGPRARPPGHRPTWAEVDLDAIAHNVGALRGVAGAPLLLAAVKADAYGHGMVPVARTAVAGGADWLGVALIEEAEVLRAAGLDVPLLLLSEPPADAVPALLAARVTPVVYTPGLLDALDAAGQGPDGPVAVHLKLDTGMHRVGAPPERWDDVIARLAAARGVRVDGVLTHLATADELGNPATDAQLTAFADGLSRVRAAGLEPRIVHAANSAATVRRLLPDADLVRPGIAVYGLEPAGPGAPPVAAHVDLRPALTWWTRVSYVKRVAPGEPVGYGGIWTAPDHRVIATVPLGYADGLPRAASNVARMVVGGHRAQVAGRISMDQTTLALPADADVAIGDPVAVIGRIGDAEVTADDWAGWLGTITYEVTTQISARVPRVHLGGA